MRHPSVSSLSDTLLPSTTLCRPSILGFALAAAIGGSFTPGLVFADTGSAAAQVTIPYQEFTLPNGLTVIVHEDHKAPIVAVNIWYGVGSKNEPAWRSEIGRATSELQSLMRISYAVFCLKKK